MFKNRSTVFFKDHLRECTPLLTQLLASQYRNQIPRNVGATGSRPVV